MSTVLSLHAHPDDEALLTGGSLARWHDEGHRVVVVTATDGGGGLSGSALTSTARLAEVRRRELEESCATLGVDRLVCLGYPDSGSSGAASPGTFATLPVGEIARRIDALVRAEGADVVIGYDQSGGYGHPDHRQVHRVARELCRPADAPELIEVTVDRRVLQRALRLVAWLPRLPDGFDPARFDDAFTGSDDITDVLDVRAYAARKRSAFGAHRSQTEGDDGRRTLAWCGRLPPPLFTMVFGREWFVRPQHEHKLTGEAFSLLRPSH